MPTLPQKFRDTDCERNSKEVDMGVEIERKFRVVSDIWRSSVERSLRVAQGYLTTNPDRTVRVRQKGDRGELTIKGRGRERGLVRSEYEYEIPVEEALQILSEFCADRIVEKVRHEVRVGDHLWEIDEFSGANEGLIVAEVELSGSDEDFLVPRWVGEEVTGQVRYYNARLAQEPFCQWNETKGEQ